MENKQQPEIKKKKISLYDHYKLRRFGSRKEYIVAVTLAVVLIIATIFVSRPGWLYHSIASADASGAGVDDMLHGLPVDNFSTQDIINGNINSTVKIEDLKSLFQNGMNSFIVAKVDRIDTVNVGDVSKAQVSYVTVIDNIYGINNGENIAVFQNDIAGGKNLLRVDGVYLLPLHKQEGNEYIMGETDFLLEIDDSGKVWSHSSNDNFSKYDGQSAADVISQIKTLTSDNGSN